MARLIDFVRTGELGVVRFGLTKDEVRELLGEPEGVGPATKGWWIWMYGSLEVSFLDGVATMIAVSLWDAPVTFPSPLAVELGPFTPGARLADVRDALDEAGIASTLDEGRTFEEQAVLVAGGWVEITFGEGRVDEVIALQPGVT